MLFLNVQEKCKEQNRTIASVEREAGLTPRSLYKWQFIMPGADKVKAVASVLGVSMEELLKDDETTET